MRIAFVLCLLAASPLYAASSSQSISVQGVLRDGFGQLQSMPVDLDVSLYASQADTTPFYTQHLTGVAIDNGFFSFELGDGTLALSGQPDAWIGVLVAGDAAELPRQHITAAPYALSAAACTLADDAKQLGGIPAANYQQKLKTAQCPTGQMLTGIAADGTATCSALTGWVKIYDQQYNANGVQTVPLVATTGPITVRISFTGTVTPFSDASEIYVRTSAGGTTGYNSFIIAESVSATSFNTGPVVSSFMMARTADTSVSQVSFEYHLTENPGVGAFGFGQGNSNGLLERGGGSISYAGTSTSLSIAFWNTSNVKGRFVVMQLL